MKDDVLQSIGGEYKSVERVLYCGTNKLLIVNKIELPDGEINLSRLAKAAYRVAAFAARAIICLLSVLERNRCFDNRNR